MTTYVQKKNRLWLERKDLTPERRRSESRLKTYSSSTDIRNWCDVVEDRRQHILELVVKDIGKCFGKIIPIDVIINALLAMANADIAKLKNCMKQLWSFVYDLKLTPEDLKKLKEMSANMDMLCTDQKEKLEESDSDECSRSCVARMRHIKEKAEIKALVKGTLSDTTDPKIRTRMKEPGKMITRIKRLAPDFQVVEYPEKPGKITIKAASPHKTGNVGPSSSKVERIHEDIRSRTSSPDRSIKTNSKVIRSINGKGVIPDKLAATQALCHEQKNKIEELTKERNNLKKKLEACLQELDNFKKLQAVSNPILPASCQQEIEALEAEINIMRKGNLSPEEEATIIKKEVEVLKRYCAKVREVECENEKLKEKLGSKVALKDSDTDLDQAKVETLKDKLKNLESLTNERDMLANRVHLLEKQLLQYQDLPNDLELLKNRSELLDGALEERDNLCKKVKQMKGLEEELKTFKKKAERVDELERELRSMNKGDRNSGIELKKTRSIAGSLEQELQNAKSEKDAMQKRMDSMKKELENQKAKVTEAEMLRLERDRLQIKLNELADIQVQYEDMINKIRIFDNIKAERDMYKQKYEEVLDIECRCEMLKEQVEEARSIGRERDHLQKQVQDLESCICEQEDEIKDLVTQVENSSNYKYEDEVIKLQKELNKKEKVIASSKEQLAQSQGLVFRVKELEKQLHHAEHKLLQKECHIKCLENQIRCKLGSIDASKKLNQREMDAVQLMSNELETARAENKRLQEITNKIVSVSGDDHMKNIIKQSECAVKRVVQELDKQYKEWDHIKVQNPKGKFATTKRDCFCHSQGI